MGFAQPPGRCIVDAQEFLVLKTDLGEQLALIDVVYERLEDRAQDFNAGCTIQMESVAYQIHSSYNAIKGLLRLVAAHFEYQVGDAARWHSGLLPRMTQPVPGVRPAPLTKETYLLLDGLRGFRHLFLHGYAVAVEPALLQFYLERARRAQKLLHRDISDFLEQLRPAQ